MSYYLLVSPPLSFIGRRWKAVAAACKRILRLAFLHKQFNNILAEFLVEVGVLWFVFPILDTIVQFGSARVTTRTTLLSIGVASVCLLAAGIISGEPEEEDQP